jgi:hypothetical protein
MCYLILSDRGQLVVLLCYDPKNSQPIGPWYPSVTKYTYHEIILCITDLVRACVERAGFSQEKEISASGT